MRRDISEDEARDIIDAREEQDAWERGAWDRANKEEKRIMNYKACEQYEKRIYDGGS